MARNHIAEGEHFNYAAGTAVSSGAVVVMTDMIGVSLRTLAAGETGPVNTEDVFELAKLSSDAITQGQIVYWDNTNKRITTTATGNTRAGKAYAAAAAGTTLVQVKLNV